ncbi:MAG: ASCH domain-containing protein [Proteobacteria bacterium]|nr:ASCH domain-containing protein [Pseudomonadota bacterium]
MLFIKKLRDPIKNGDITTSIRIWKSPHVKKGGRYRLDQGHIVVTSIREITFEDISESLAKESGFNNLADLMKTAKHGEGFIIYFIRFYYEE